MGASSWKYRIPYQPDVILALRQLREGVFERGEFDTTGGLAQMLATITRLKPDAAPELEKKIGPLIAQKMLLRDSQSIEELLERCAESGTHSILDIDSITDAPTVGSMSPVSDEALLELFGTTKPTGQMFESDGQSASGFYQTGLYGLWQAVYVVLYRNDMPDEIYIEGVSGD